MKIKSKKRRQIVSATLDPRHILWLEALSNSTNTPKSRLLEKAIELLKEHETVKAKEEKINAINQGIDRMIKEEGIDLIQMADSDFSPRIGEELL